MYLEFGVFLAIVGSILNMFDVDYYKTSAFILWIISSLILCAWSFEQSNFWLVGLFASFVAISIIAIVTATVNYAEMPEV